MSTASRQMAQPFGRYVLKECVGEGAMGRVYLAVRTGPMGFRKEVAVKLILSAEPGQDQRKLQSFINEARVGGFLRHPHLVEVYEFDRHQDTFYLAMEWVPGWSLAQVLEKAGRQGQPASPLAVAQVGFQVTSGLAHAHDSVDDDGEPLLLVHRDLKPGNLLVRQDAIIKISDFGIAQARTNLFHTTGSGKAKGTPSYMSPEQARGEELDGRSDLFSLALVLVELLLLRPAFAPQKDFRQTLTRIERGDVGEILEEVGRRAPRLLPLLTRCLSREREERPSSAREVAASWLELIQQERGGHSLGGWLESLFPGEVREESKASERTPPPLAHAPRDSFAGEPDLARQWDLGAPIPSPPQGERRERRRAGGWIAGALVLALVGGGMAVMRRSALPEGDEAASLTQRSTEVRVAPRSLPPEEGGGGDLWTLALSGVPVVEVGSGDAARKKAEELSLHVEAALLQGDPGAFSVDGEGRRATLWMWGGSPGREGKVLGQGNRSRLLWQRQALLSGWEFLRGGPLPSGLRGTALGSLLTEAKEGREPGGDDPRRLAQGLVPPGDLDGSPPPPLAKEEPQPHPMRDDSFHSPPGNRKGGGTKEKSWNNEKRSSSPSRE